MRTALFSDIHGNYDGLLRVLADIEEQKCDRMICLGDLVDGGPDSVEVVQLFRDRSILTVQGNHDEFPNTPLLTSVTDYLEALPKSIVEGHVLYTHTSARKKMLKITNAIEAWNVFQEAPYRRMFVGDVHIPFIYGERCAEKVSATSFDIPYDEEFNSNKMTAISCVSGLSDIAGIGMIGCGMQFMTVSGIRSCLGRQRGRY